MPSPSDPSTRTVGEPSSASSSVRSAWPASPTVRQPRSERRSSARDRLTTRATGTRSTAPAGGLGQEAAQLWAHAAPAAPPPWPEGGRRAQYGPDVLRVGDLVEHQDDALRRARRLSSMAAGSSGLASRAKPWWDGAGRQGERNLLVLGDLGRQARVALGQTPGQAQAAGAADPRVPDWARAASTAWPAPTAIPGRKPGASLRGLWLPNLRALRSLRRRGGVTISALFDLGPHGPLIFRPRPVADAGERRFAIQASITRVGGMPEWQRGRNCKSAGVRLRRFESCFPHHARPAVGNPFRSRPHGANRSPRV